MLAIKANDKIFMKIVKKQIQVIIFFFFFSFYFSRQGFSVALEPVLELALVEQAGLELMEIHPPLPHECWV